MRGISTQEPGAVASTATDSGQQERAGRLRASFRQVRGATEALCAPLSAEDQMVQSCPEASPVKWHLAHSSWFFETFVLREFADAYTAFHPDFGWLFNSYYNSLGEHPEKKLRSSFARPASGEIYAYRAHVDAAIDALLQSGPPQAALDRIEMGLHHEQQHQELIATDIKHALWTNPLRTPYGPALAPHDELPEGNPAAMRSAVPAQWVPHPGGLADIGHAGDGFAFDNESPRHTVFLQPYDLASRPVTCAEYLEFMREGGYQRPELWLSDGWDAMRSGGWEAPLYWRRERGAAQGSADAASGDPCWQVYTLRGTLSVADLADTPVCHVSYFEADAFARWRSLRNPGVRLPTEAEWEAAAESAPAEGNFVESSALHPRAVHRQQQPNRVRQMFGDVWEWTQSAYLAYPGYSAPTGALGEYNGKFMSGSMVLRGGSCATPATHIRSSYRNFFHPATRWQFSGIRLARLAPANEGRP